MVHGLDLDDRLRSGRAAVIAGELAEGTFGRELAGMQNAFDRDLAMRGDRQVDELGRRQLDRSAHDAARSIELALAGAEHLRRHHEKNRIDSVGCDHLARLAAPPPRFAVEPAMLSGRAIQADAIARLDRKSTRLNSSHVENSYAVFCLKKKTTNK